MEGRNGLESCCSSHSGTSSDSAWHRPCSCSCRSGNRICWRCWLMGRSQHGSAYVLEVGSKSLKGTKLTRRNRLRPRCASDVTLVDQMIHLLAPSIVSVDPTPRTMTSSLGTRRQIRGDLIVHMFEPRTSVVYRDDSEVFRLDLCRVALVCYPYPTPFDVLGIGRLPCVRSVHRSYPSRRSISITGVQPSLLRWVLPVRREGLVACHLAVIGPTGGEFHHLPCCRWRVDPAVEPPLIKVEVHQRCDGCRLIGVVSPSTAGRFSVHRSKLELQLV